MTVFRVDMFFFISNIFIKKKKVQMGCNPSTGVVVVSSNSWKFELVNLEDAKVHSYNKNKSACVCV